MDSWGGAGGGEGAEGGRIMLLLFDFFRPLLLLPRMVEVIMVEDHLPVANQGICLPTCCYVLWERKG